MPIFFFFFFAQHLLVRYFLVKFMVRPDLFAHHFPQQNKKRLDKRRGCYLPQTFVKTFDLSE